MSKGSILMVISDYRYSGGHESVITNYCNGLDKLGYNIAVGAFSFDKDPPENVKKVKLRKFRDLTLNNQQVFDIINTHQTHMNYYSLITPKPFVFHYHGTSNMLQEMNLRLSSFLYGKRVTKVISTSCSAMNHLKKTVDKAVISDVIYNGVDTKFYNTNLPKPYSTGDPQLLFVGNLYPHKNVLSLIDTMPSIMKKYPHAHLQIVGNGSDYRRIQLRIQEKNLDANIGLIGPLFGEELRLRYSSCDMYVSASKLEAWPLPPLEALACGKPLLLSDIPAHREVVEASNAGRTFSLLSNFGIPNLIQEILENKQHYSMAARKYAETCDWSVACCRLAKVYDEIISQSLTKKE